MGSVKTILISQYPLPYHKIGSWTNMYNFYLNQPDHQIDYIICAQSNAPISSVEYQKLRSVTIIDKFKNKVKTGSRFTNYFEALGNIVKPNQKYIIQIIDHSGLLLPLHQYIKGNYERDNFQIQYFYHGFSPMLPKNKIDSFAKAIDKMIFLTKLSYQEHLQYYDQFIIPSSVLHNGVDEQIFFKENALTKEILKKEANVNDKLVFIWCSQDRPKKGLDLLLKIWKYIYKNHSDNIVLLVVGTNRKIQQDGVVNVGRIANTDLSKYYQMSDVYVFPSLWKEGFGIVLAEALRCGCYCIASSQGGIPEVLAKGKFGKLIDFPNSINIWVKEIEAVIKDFKMNNGINIYAKNIPEDIYSLSVWKYNYDAIINDSKFLLEN